MALHKLERRNYGRKWPVSIKYQNLHFFKEGLILLCQSILEMRRVTHLYGSGHFTIPLKVTILVFVLGEHLLIHCRKASNEICAMIDKEEISCRKLIKSKFF